MKLLVNATTITSLKLTGIERFALRLCQELYRIDGDVQIFSGIPLSGIPTANVPFWLSLGNRLLKKREYLLRAFWDQTFFRHQANKNRPDVVFFPIPDGMVSPPFRQVVTVHDLHYLHFDKELTECKAEISRVRTKFYRYKFPRILNDSSAIITVSATTRDELVQRFSIIPEKIHIIHNGYDDKRFQEIHDPRPVLEQYGIKPRQYFLYVGSILRHKNLIRLVQALGKLKNDVGLIMVGVCKDSVYLQEIFKVVGSSGIKAGRFRYLGYVSDDDLPHIYSGAIAFVLPSLHEGFGVPLIEAMACGVPVITSNCSAMPEVAGKAAFFVDPYSVEHIAHAMNEVLNHQKAATELKRLGLERAQQFLWARSAQKLYNLFTSLKC